MSALESNIEALIFCSPKPINVEDIQKSIFEYNKTKYKSSEIENGIQRLKNRYNNNNCAIEIIESGGGYQEDLANQLIFSRRHPLFCWC